MISKRMGFLRGLLRGVGVASFSNPASARQLVPENLDLMRTEELATPKGNRLIDRLQVQRLSEEGTFPGGKSIPELPPKPSDWLAISVRREGLIRK